ncbi:NADH:ubiquinone oxidoreductase [Halocynthiibacter styelae]|uniref:NADH:ubiquinone oxidoreductase n=1 Tax=Halocynthiibacter styelae TaxID=2761955 RepID=UPI001E3C83FE|nr:NADH:ubiquinone oxidoreductase [Paenihalocynthiibacter styelae]
MNENQGLNLCSIVCWAAAAVGALIAWWLMSCILWNWLAILISLVVLLLLGFFLVSRFCGLQVQAPLESTLTTPAPAAAAQDDAAEETAVEEVTEAPAAQAEAAPEEKSAEEVSSEEVAPAEEPAIDAEADDTAEKQPEVLKTARAGGADDLKQLKGVGPKLEETLNELGFWHFDQIAAWGTAEIEWVDARLKFKGRITRDNWVDQAKALASGDETEFSKRVKDGDVY